MRVAPSDAKSAFFSPDKNNTLRIEAKNPGQWGNSIYITFEQTNENKTQIMKDLGSGKYKLKSAFGFDAGDVVILQGLKAPLTAVIKNVKNNVITLDKPFKGEVVDTELVPKITLKTCELNILIECEDLTEEYKNVNFNTLSPNCMNKVLSKSELINIIFKDIEKNTTPPFEYLKNLFKSKEEEFIKINLSEGNDGTVTSLTDDDFIGKDDGPGARTGIQAFLDNTDVSILTIPGIVSPNVQLSLVSQCENLGSRFAILDMPLSARTTTDVNSETLYKAFNPFNIFFITSPLLS